MIQLDNGYFFGIGVFETFSVKNRKLQLEDFHWERLLSGLNTLEIILPCNSLEALIERTYSFIHEENLNNCVLKVSISEKNIVFNWRKNPYQSSDYQNGFSLSSSSVFRNETSPFTYIKSLNYGDNIQENGRVKAIGFHDALFYNSKNEISETSTGNIFFMKGNSIYTPSVSCGILPGTVRRFLIEQTDLNIHETSIYNKDLEHFDEAFLSNSVIGIMPIAKIDDLIFTSRNRGLELHKKYSGFF